MTKTKDDIDAAARYSVTLKRKVERPNGVWLVPGRAIKISGKVLLEIKDAVDGFTRIGV